MCSVWLISREVSQSETPQRPYVEIAFRGRSTTGGTPQHFLAIRYGLNSAAMRRMRQK